MDLAVLKATVKASQAKRICALCKGDATVFRSELDEIEYNISALCQKCQDKVFEGLEE